MVNTFGEYVWAGMDQFEIIDIYWQDNVTYMPSTLSHVALTNRTQPNVEMMEQRYALENQLIQAVTQGNSQKAEQLITNFSFLAFEERSPEPLRNLKNYCIIMNTLLRKAAENGGVHPVWIDSVSSDIAKRIEAMHSLSLVQNFMPEIIRAYCRLVKQHATKNLSPLIRDTAVRIENDLTADLSLCSLAAQANVNAAYLSARFKAEIGQTLTNYVNKKRISLAKHLLQNTALQIQTIAQHCGVLDLHYFCHLFKKVVGISPSEYRRSGGYR